MNKKDIAQIRRRLNPESQNPVVICGCYVNGQKNVVSAFRRSLISLPQSESEKYMQIFRRSLSGDVGRNLVPLNFPTDEVMDGATHARLIRLNQTALDDDEALNAFFDAIIAGTRIEGNFLILVLHDTYDVPFKTSMDDEAAGAESETVFSYVLCAVCPVKQTKPCLSYSASENDFHALDPDWVVASPDMGFLFPAFEDGGPNIHSALFYTRDLAESHDDFVAAALNAGAFAPAAEQKETFKTVLREALEDECSFEVVEAVNEHIVSRLEEQKQDKEAEPARIGKREVEKVLTDLGVSPERTQSFSERFDEEFGLGNDLPAAGIADDKQMELRTGEVTIRVNPGCAGLVETRTIDGVKYILIRADEGVCVNGVNVDI